MHDRDYHWTKQAAEILSRAGWRMKRYEKQGVISYGAISKDGAHSIAGTACANVQRAFMGACYRALQALGHPHWRLCPYGFPA